MDQALKGILDSGEITGQQSSRWLLSGVERKRGQEPAFRARSPTNVATGEQPLRGGAQYGV